MKRATLYTGITILTLLTGFVSVWFLGLLPRSVNPGTDESSNLIRDVPAVESTPDAEVLLQHHFKETFRACKPGYVQGYVTEDGQEVAEGNNRCHINDSKATESEFSAMIGKASRVIERDGGRVVLEFDNKDGKYAEILRYDGGVCISFIHAPTLQLALEFEKSNSYNR